LQSASPDSKSAGKISALSAAGPVIWEMAERAAAEARFGRFSPVRPCFDEMASRLSGEVTPGVARLLIEFYARLGASEIFGQQLQTPRLFRLLIEILR
jgi:hypothetical protein